jgi:ATP synthase protein I
MSEEPKPPLTSHYGNAMGLAFELVATTAVGAFLGWLIDSWLNTRVIFLFVFALMGGAAGVLRLYRTYGTDKGDD